MSCSYVRLMVKKWCREADIAQGVKFYDTINIEQKPRENVWFTVMFYADNVSGTFCTDNYMEEGAVTVVVAAQPGRGDKEAVDALEKIVPELLKKTDPKLEFEGWEPIFEDSAGSADRNYRVSAILNYRHSST